jgi:hypothetical protein
VSSWIYDKKPNLRLRVDVCRRCKKQRTRKDFTAPDELAAEKKFKLKLWEERRQVIVEKHRNPKRYTIQVRFKDDKIPFLKQERFIMDEDVEKLRKEITGKIVLIGNVIFEMIDMDEEQPPEELL